MPSTTAIHPSFSFMFSGSYHASGGPPGFSSAHLKISLAEISHPHQTMHTVTEEISQKGISQQGSFLYLSGI